MRGQPIRWMHFGGYSAGREGLDGAAILNPVVMKDCSVHGNGGVILPQI
jgi:hypothetical protein